MTDPLTQTEKNKKWRTKNKEHSRYLTYRSTARNFVKKHATMEDLQELENLIADRRKSLGE